MLSSKHLGENFDIETPTNYPRPHSSDLVMYAFLKEPYLLEPVISPEFRLSLEKMLTSCQ